ncbi:MAG TPA: hypothetical protein VGM90_40580 [Kofleriaceae bacterium]|jgi:hypothetical protein
MPTDEQIALLAKRRAELPTWATDSVTIADDFIRMVCAADPTPYLADYDRFVPAIDEMVGSQAITPDDMGRMRTPLFCFIAEYLVRTLAGTWVVDDVADSQYFAQYMIEVPLGSGPDVLRLSPYHLAQGYLTSPAPRSLATALRAIVKRVKGDADIN